MESRCVYLKHLVFRENDFSKRVQLRSEYNALIHCSAWFLFFALITVSMRTCATNSNFHFTVTTSEIGIVFSSLLELCILNDYSLYAFQHLVGSGVSTFWDKIRFAVRFNGFAGFIVLFLTAFSFCFFWLLQPLDNVFTETLQNTQQTTYQGFVVELEEAFSNSLPAFVCTQILFLFLVVGLFALYSKHKFENGRVIFSVDFDKSGQQNEYSIDKCGMSLVLKKGESESLDLSSDKLTFAKDSVIVVKKSSSKIYDHGELQKIVIKGNKIDAEIKFSDSLGQWVYSSLAS